MAEFLTTQGTSHNLENIIINASKWLVLICPYLNITENFLQRLQDADKRKVRICIVFGKKELSSEEEAKLRKLENLSLRYYKNLHAKCYSNEDTMIITSMNLNEFSEKTNREMGILIRREEPSDQRIFQDAIREVKSIIDLSKKQKGGLLKAGEVLFDYLNAIANKDVSSLFTKHGYCIRCGREISYDLNKPYCKECYFSLPELVDTLHIEKYCHSCGKEYKTRMNYPQCHSCYQKSKGN